MARLIAILALLATFGFMSARGAEAPAPAVAPVAPPLALEGVLVSSDRAPDLSSAANFAKSIFRIERTRDEQEEAETLYRWMEQLVMVGPPAFEAEGRKGDYTHHAGRIICVHGYSTCDGIGTSLVQLWRALGRGAHKTYVPSRGHTIAELEYRDRDGQTRWHAFDAHGHWYAKLPDGRVAGIEDLARQPDLVPLRGSWSGYKMAGSAHVETFPVEEWGLGLALHPRESVTLLFDGGGRYFTRAEMINAENRREFFKDGSLFRRTIGAAHFEYRPDFKAVKLEETCLASGAALAEGAAATAAADAPATLEFDFPSPFIYTGGVVEAHVRCAGAGDSVTISVRPGPRGPWVKLVEHSAAGQTALKADLGAEGPACIRGLYGFRLKVELKSKVAGGAALAGLNVERWGQFNPRALPKMEIGWNNFKVDARRAAQAGWAPEVTVAWTGRDGAEFERRTPAVLPFSFDVFGARRNDEPGLVMRHIRVACVPAPKGPAALAERGCEKTAKSDEPEKYPGPEIAERLLALARSGKPEAAGQLQAMLKDADPEVRYWAAHGLGEIGGAGAVPAIAEVLKNDPSELVRLSAANALGLTKSPEAVPPLIEALKRTNYKGVDKDKVLPFEVCAPRWEAARSLAAIGDKRAVQPLVAELAGGEGDYMVIICEALVRMDAREALPALCAKLRQYAWGMRARALCEALGDLAAREPADSKPRAEAAELLIGQLGNKRADVVAAACAGLGKMKEKRAIEPLEKLLAAKPDELTAVAARKALERIKTEK